MPTFSINEALRYLVTAAIIAAYGYWMSTPAQVTSIRTDVGDPALTVLVFAGSAIGFNAYRQLVYNILIRFGFDLLRDKCKWAESLLGIGPRNFLRRQLKGKGCSQWIQAAEVWAFCTVKWVQGEAANAMRVWGAGVHGFYFLATASFVAASVAPDYSALGGKVGWVVLVGFASLLLGFIADTFHEQAETMLASDIWSCEQKQKCIKTAWDLMAPRPSPE